MRYAVLSTALLLGLAACDWQRNRDEVVSPNPNPNPNSASESAPSPNPAHDQAIQPTVPDEANPNTLSMQKHVGNPNIDEKKPAEPTFAAAPQLQQLCQQVVEAANHHQGKRMEALSLSPLPAMWQKKTLKRSVFGQLSGARCEQVQPTDAGHATVTLVFTGTMRPNQQLVMVRAENGWRWDLANYLRQHAARLSTKAHRTKKAHF